MDGGDVYLVLGDPNRKRLLDLVVQGERTVTDLIRATRLRQPLVSHHLRVLRDAGLVTTRKEGRFRLYRVASPETARLVAKLDEGAGALRALAERQAEAPARAAAPGAAPSAALRGRSKRA